MEGATEHSAVVQALLDDLIERGLDPAVPRLFIIDARRRRRGVGRHMPIQRCQIDKARNIMERSSPGSACPVRRCVRPGNWTTPLCRSAILAIRSRSA
jgi:putative transposase